MASLRVSTWAIKNPIPVSLLFAVLVLGGVVAYNLLPIKQYPNVTFPEVVVTVTQNGAAPAEMETQITRPVEDAMSGITNVRSVQSVVALGVSTTIIDFQLNEDLQRAVDEVRQKVDETRAILPREIDPPDVSRVDIDNSPIITYAVSAPSMSPAQLSWFVDNTISRGLQAEQGVAQVARLGGVDREVNVIVDPDRMAARGLTASALNTALASADLDAPGGRTSVGGREQTVRVLGAAADVPDLRDMMVPAPGGHFVRLSDVAQVGDGTAEPRVAAYLNGRPVIGFEVLKTPNSSDVQVEDRVMKALTKLEKDHPEVSFTKLVSTVDDTRLSFAATLHTMIEGMLLASLVVWLFLRDWRSTAITAIAMPVSLIPTFLIMLILHFSLNVVTLLGLTLVIGILVDDAIVEIENIQKRVLAGARPYRAAMEGADAIGLAVLATTAAVVVVFTPVSFMNSIIGQFFKEFGITVAVAVLFSLLVARFLTPLLSAYFLKPTADPHPRPPLNRHYAKALDWCLTHRFLTAGAGVVIFILSLVLMSVLPSGVQPPDNPDFMYVGIQGPPGATMADMTRISDQTSRLLRGLPEVTDVFSEIGMDSTGFGANSLSSGVIIVMLKPHRSATVTQIQDRVRDQLKTIPDARVDFQGGGFGSAAVQIVLSSENGAVLERVGETLEQQMGSLNTLADPRPDHPPIGPEIVIRPLPDQAARLGVDASAIAEVARIATLGDIDANVAKMNDGERRIPIRVRLPKDARSDIDLIRSLQVPTANGGTTPLSSVADVSFQAGPSQIYRYNRRRFVAIDADLTHGAQLGEALKEVNKLPVMQQIGEHPPSPLANKKTQGFMKKLAGACRLVLSAKTCDKIPTRPPPTVADPYPDVHQEALGQAQQFQELMGQMLMAFGLGILMIYAVMVLLFRSFFKPITILFALLLAIGGAVLALMIMREAISIPSLIGLLMLLGLAAKNSILLVEFAIERERAGLPQRQAIMEACRERARPIIMTTVAMAAGMLPTALGIGKGSEFRQPMAVTVIGGLVTSTLLSLVMVPVVYEIIEDFEAWLTPKFARFVTPREAAPSAPATPPAPAE